MASTFNCRLTTRFETANSGGIDCKWAGKQGVAG